VALTDDASDMLVVVAVAVAEVSSLLVVVEVILLTVVNKAVVDASVEVVVAVELTTMPAQMWAS
jgi:hypothetical protein